MNAEEINECAIQLKDEYVYKLNVDPEALKKVTEFLNKSKWGAFSAKSYGGAEGNFEAKVKNGEFQLKAPDNQYQLKKDDQLFKCKEFKEIVENSEIKKILTAYFGREPKLNKKRLNVFYTQNKSGKFKQIKKQGWHMDDPKRFIENPKYNFIKLFIPLCDVTEENGATRIIKGSRENTPPGFVYKDYQGKRVSDDFIYKHYSKDLEIKLESTLGDIFLTRNDGFHKGGHCKSGSRLMVIAQYDVS